MGVSVYCGLRYCVIGATASSTIVLQEDKVVVDDLELRCNGYATSIVDQRTQRRCTVPLPKNHMGRVQSELCYLDQIPVTDLYLALDVLEPGVSPVILGTANALRRAVHPKPGIVHRALMQRFYRRFVESLSGKAEHPGAVLYECATARKTLFDLFCQCPVVRERVSPINLQRCERTLMPIQYASLAGIVASTAAPEDAAVLYDRARSIVREYRMLPCSWWG